jgi:hypothetical protein
MGDLATSKLISGLLTQYGYLLLKYLETSEDPDGKKYIK